MSDQLHFLIVTFPALGHVNPSLGLASRLAAIGAHVTFSTPLSAHRRLQQTAPSAHNSRNAITFVAYSDNDDDSMPNIKSNGRKNLPDIIRSLAADGRPVTCVIYTIFLTFAADVARQLSIPAVHFWIQPATVFAIYHHYFHGYRGVISSHAKDPNFAVSLPGLPSLRMKDLPSFLSLTSSDEPFYDVISFFEETFDALEATEEGNAAVVLMNTCAELEAEAIAAMQAGGGGVELIPVGPTFPPVWRPSEVAAPPPYMGWLDGKAEGSVVYVSFGSVAALKERQVAEVSRGLLESGRPFLWAAGKAAKYAAAAAAAANGDGLVVEWCDQATVLGHVSVGCFVTHCGWNSALEGVAAGVPAVGIPQWADQGTAAWLLETTWRTGVRAAADVEGVVTAEELKSCLDAVMDDEETTKRAKVWGEKAAAAVADGGSSATNLTRFVEEIERMRT